MNMCVCGHSQHRHERVWSFFRSAWETYCNCCSDPQCSRGFNRRSEQHDPTLQHRRCACKAFEAVAA